MALRDSTFAACDRCGTEQVYASRHEATLYTMQLRVTGLKIAYAPHHDVDGNNCAYVCPECAHSFRDWWREPHTRESA